MRTACALLALIAGLTANGCGRSESPATPDPVHDFPPPPEPDLIPPATPYETTAPSAPDAAEMMTSPSARPTEPEAASETEASGDPHADYAAALQRALDLEVRTAFSQAYQICRDLQDRFKEPEQAAELDATLRRLQAARRQGPQLEVALSNLGAADARARQIARDMLQDAGELGLLFLRHGLRTGNPPVALEAGRILAEMRDLSSVPLFLDLIRNEAGTPRGQAIRSLAVLTPYLDAEIGSACLDAIQADNAFAATPVIDVLEPWFEHVCRSDEAAFNAAVGHPFGLDVVRAYVGAAFLSTNAVVIEWACARLPDFLPLLKGLRGEYFADAEFGNRVIDRVDARIHIDNRTFPHPDGQQDDLSVRWTGGLLVREAGEYTFNLNAHPHAWLWLGESQILHAHHWHRNERVTRTLWPGWHPLRIDYSKGPGNGMILFSWSGSSARLQARPWPDLVPLLHDAIVGLAAHDNAIANASRRLLTEAQGLGRILLFEALDAYPDNRAMQALDLLTTQTRQIPVYRYRQLYEEAFADDAIPMNAALTLLYATLWRDCGNDPGTLGERLGDPDAYTRLTAHLASALASDDGDVVARARRTQKHPGLAFEYFEGAWLHGGYLPAFDELTPLTNGVVDTFSLEPRRRDTDFAFRYSGLLLIETAGEYRLFTNSDDGSKLFINGDPIVNNDGPHGMQEREGTVNLQPGYHSLVLEFCQGAGGFGLQVSWQGPGISKAEIPATVLYHQPF